VGECVAWWDKEHEEYVRKVLEQHPPGSYKMSAASAKEAMDKYFKTEKTRWQSMFMHDCFLALLRKDEEMKGILKEAYTKLAEAFDWPEKEPWTSVEESPTDAAFDAANALFSLYAEALRVEGWRSKVDETVKKAKSRLLKEPSPIGDKYRTEYGRWVALGRVLHELEEELRLKDRVAYWEALEVEALARSVARKESIRLSSYMEGIVKEVLGETGMDYQWDTAMWYFHKAWVELEEHRAIEGSYGSYDNEELLVMAIMAADGVKPTTDEGKQREYLEGVARRLNMPELVELYYTAKFGPRDLHVFYKAFMKEWEEMTDEEKRFFEEQRKACWHFMLAVGRAIDTLLARKGKITFENLD